MSWQHIKAVWANSKSKGAARLVLVCVADHVNDGGEAWPSVTTISRETQVSERQVKRAIDWLVENEELAILEQGNGRGRSTTYQFLLPLPPQKGDISAQKGDTTSPLPIAQKGDILARKGDISAERVTFETVKGDTMSPQIIIEIPEERKKENKERIEVEQPELPPSYLRLIPIEMATPEFIAAVGEWLAYQHELTGRELPTRTLKNQLLTLRNYPVQTAIAMINQSINQGWKGLFDLRQSGGNGKSSSNGHYPKPTPEPLPEEDWSTAPPPPTW